MAAFSINDTVPGPRFDGVGVMSTGQLTRRLEARGVAVPDGASKQLLQQLVAEHCAEEDEDE